MLIAVVSCICGFCSAQSWYVGQFADKLQSPVMGETQAECFNLSDITLLDGRFKDNQERQKTLLLNLSLESLLHSFKVNAGLFSGKEGGYMTVRKYGGWESMDCELRGHTTGHCLSALALMWASTNDVRLRLKGDSIVGVLKEVQEAIGTGYVSAFPEQLIERNIQGKSVWAPWYTLHKLLAGLLDQYLYADNKDALLVARNFAAWAYGRLRGEGEETRQRMLRNEFGGIGETFLNLYALTLDDRCLWLYRWFYHNEVIDPLKLGNADFGKKHTNTFIPKVIAEARAYELLGKKDGLQAAQYFFDEMLKDHIFVTGSLSDKEHFFNPKAMSHHLTGYTGESCCAYNMLRLAKHLFSVKPDSRIMDYYERALLNQILGQQDTETGLPCYFLPMENGAFKLYATRDSSFWCCMGSAMESNSKLQEAAYAHGQRAVYVNLFMPSTLFWREKGVRLRQETAFPYGQRSTITIEENDMGEFEMQVRRPWWCGDMRLRVNGKAAKARLLSSGYLAIKRRWRAGDRLEMTFPMKLTSVACNGDRERQAVMLGPVVLAGCFGREGMSKREPFSNPKAYNDYYNYNFHVPQTLDFALPLISEPLEDVVRKTDKPLIESRIKANRISGDKTQPKADSLLFTTVKGTPMKPLFDVHHERYAVYWQAE